MKKIFKSSRLKCVFCRGKGVQPGDGRLSCIACKGSGHFTVRQPYNICKECGGEGKKTGATLYCLPCHGKGFVEESRHPLTVELPAPRTKREKTLRLSLRVKKRRKGEFRKRKSARNIQPVTPPPKANHPRAEKVRKEKVIIKKEKKSFFKKLFGYA